LSIDVAANAENNANLTREKTEELKDLEGVVDVAPAYDLGSQLKYKETVSDATATITKPVFLKLDGKKIVEGKTLPEGGSPEVILASSFSKIYGDSPEDMVGKDVSFSLRVPRETAVGNRKETERLDIEKNFKIAGFFESEDLSFFVNLDDLQDVIPPTVNYSRLKIKCSGSDTLDQLKNKIADMGFTVSSLSETVSEVNRMFTGIKTVLALFGMVALLVSAIGMFNTMTVALLERTKEIGIMKAIGASNLNILSMFILEATTMGFLGGLSGIFLGVTSGSVVNWLINMAAWKLGGNSVALFSYPIWFLIFIVGFSVFIGFLTGIVPARRASSIDPLDALRSK
jgi:putative ABC transport system permease protein